MTMRHRSLLLAAAFLAALAAAPARAQDFKEAYRRGVGQLEAGQTDEAIRTMESALAALNGRPAPDPTIYSNLGWAQMQAGRLDEAEKSFAQAEQEWARLSPEEQRTLRNNQSQLARLRNGVANGKGG
jgi:tetratricopeptide (TPR) repeat protein